MATRPAAKKMGKRTPTTKRVRGRQQQAAIEIEGRVIEDPVPRRALPGPLEPKTPGQKRYMAAIKAFDVVFGLGPAGTGKTYIAAALAADALVNRTIDRIIVTRPAVEAGESLGFLPGEIEEKFDPYLQPFRDVLNERLGKSHVDALIKAGRIEAAPLAYMRGRTFKNAFVILDEAQNTTPNQMLLFLTRVGENCRVVVNGDTAQIDLQGPSGLADAVSRLSHVASLRVIKLTVEDIVRSGFVRAVVDAYQNQPVKP